MPIHIVNNNLSLVSNKFTTKNGTFICVCTEDGVDTWKHIETGKYYKYARKWLRDNQKNFS